MFELVPIVAIISTFGSIVLVVGIIARVVRKRTQARTEQLNRLLDRFGTADEFIAFAQTKAGAELIEAISAGQRKRQSSVTRSIKWGLLTALPGLGFIILAMTHEEDMIVPGVLLLTLGIGFLISAYVTYRLREQESDDNKLMEEAFPS